MTLEQAGRMALCAAAAGDIQGLESALRTRAQAIRDLRAQPASEALFARLLAAHRVGEAVDDEIRRFKLRTTVESARLARMERALSAGFGSPRPCARLNFRV